MSRLNLFILIAIFTLSWPEGAAAFRVCNLANSHAYSASTQYSVGEIAFDHASGLAEGTETTYNYSNREAEGFSRCHITYELSGIFEPASGTLLLDAQRTSHSATCPQELIAIEYPTTRQYSLQIEFEDDKTSRVHLADNGEVMASGEWDNEKTLYRTDEKCTAF